MILRFLPSGTSNGDAPIKYLLSKKDSKGLERNPPPVILYGNPDVTKGLIDSCPRKFKYTSAVIAFRDNEHPTNFQLASIIHDLRETLAPGMGPSRVNMFAVLHRDKGNTEVHIIFPMTDLKTGKQFNVMPPGKAGKQLASDWQASWNHKLGYDQVVENPLKTFFSSLDLKLAKFENPTKLMSKRFQTKKKMSEFVADKISSGQLKNRDDLIELFESAGMVITRKGCDYISVRGSDPNLKAIRLKGPAYSEGVQYSDLRKQVEENAAQGAKLSETDAFMVNLRLKRAVADREDFNRKRDAKIPKLRTYTLPGQPKPIRTPAVKTLARKQKSEQAWKSIQERLASLRSEEKEPQEKEPVSVTANNEPVIAQASKKSQPKPSEGGSSSVSPGVPSSDLDMSIIQVQSEIDGLNSIIAGAGSAKKKSEAILRVYQLRQRLYDLQERKRLEKIRQLNLPKPMPGFI